MIYFKQDGTRRIAKAQTECAPQKTSRPTSQAVKALCKDLLALLANADGSSCWSYS